MSVDVLIAGAGPVGLTLATELARYGLHVRIIDKNSERTDKSKAIVIWARTLELLERMGSGCVEVCVGGDEGDRYLHHGRARADCARTSQRSGFTLQVRADDCAERDGAAAGGRACASQREGRARDRTGGVCGGGRWRSLRAEACRWNRGDCAGVVAGGLRRVRTA